MSNPRPQREAQTPRFSHHWYLREWMLERGKRQVDMINELGWSKGKASEVAQGQQYTQALIDVLAPWLGVEPWELLLPPGLAKNIKLLRESAAAIVAESSAEFSTRGLNDIAPSRGGKH